MIGLVFGEQKIVVRVVGLVQVIKSINTQNQRWEERDILFPRDSSKYELNIQA